MSWLPFAMAAAPTIISMFQDKPSMPGRAPSVYVPDRSNYSNQILQEAFASNPALLEQALSQSMSSINHDLVNRGLGYSSIGDHVKAGMGAKLASEWAAKEMERRLAAYNAVTGNDMREAQLRAGLAQSDLQNQWNQYNASNAQNDRDMANWQSLGQVGMAAYGDYTARNRYERADARNQANFDRYMNYLETAQAPSGGQYVYQPGSPGLGVDYSRLYK